MKTSKKIMLSNISIKLKNIEKIHKVDKLNNDVKKYFQNKIKKKGEKMKKISDIMYLILKIIGIIVICFLSVIIGIIVYLIGMFVYYKDIDPYKYRTKIVNDYLSRNIIIDRDNISGGKLRGDDVRYTEFTDNKEYENKYIEIEDPSESEDYFYLLGLEKYIADNLLYDKSKGNHFDKIEEYLQKNRERIFKIFLNLNDKAARIYFNMDIMYKLPNGELYWHDQRRRINNYIIEFLGEYGNENYVENKEKGFFKEKVKYEDIDWGKYIEYMEVYPVLYMNVIYKDDKDNIFNTEIRNNSRNSEKLLEIYKEMEKFYNKKTFNFVIRKL